MRFGILFSILASTMFVANVNLGAENSVGGTTASAGIKDLADLDLEQLAKVDVIVTSASKKEESLSGAPAAIFVITGEEIRRGGFSTLPDALRMVPGLTVAQHNAHAWTISARGFDTFPNEKMLVLIDGRSVYSPLYGGVNWDVQEIPLDEIDHIEVIRGPGGALWGENAINGVINIITKSAEQTVGGHASGVYGHDGGYVASSRFGGQGGKNLFYRIYGSSAYSEPFVDESGTPLRNNWNMTQLGTRMDWKASGKDTVMLEMRGYDGRVRDVGSITTPASQAVVDDLYPIRGGNALARWDHVFSGHSNTSILAYCDWSDRGDIAFGAESRNTCEVGGQHSFKINERHSLIWGGEFRSTADQTRVTFYNHFSPPDFRENLASVFGQYEWTILPERLKIIGGSKFGHNSYTGFEIQPQIRAVWTPHKGHNVWGAVSRAVRIPTRSEENNFLLSNNIPGPTPTYFAFVGTPGLRPAVLKAYELGYRFQPVQAFSIDVAAFYNDYRDLISPAPSALPPIVNPNPPYTLVLLTFGKGGNAQTHGVEISAKFQPWHSWLLSMGVTEDRGTSFSMQSTPRHQFNMQSHLNLSHNFNFDSAWYYYDIIPASQFSFNGMSVPTRNRVDAGLSWHTKQGLTLELWGRNLQDQRHSESIPTFIALAASAQTRRAVVAKISWDFRHEPKPSK